MTYSNIIYEVKDGLAFVTINRPQKMNALNAELIDELFDAFHRIKTDAAIQAAMITGAGDKAFISGADIQELSRLNPMTGKEKMLKGHALFNLIENAGKLVVAAVNGFALGGGCELAMACTLRLASVEARFGQPEINLGVIPGYGGTQRLSRLVGKGRALEMILSGDMIDAAEAYRIGLVNKVYPKDRLPEETETFCRRLMTKGPIATHCALEAVNKGLNQTLEDGLNLEANLFGLLCATEDMKEGLTAFLEKRKPAFKGK
ncbi:MAG: enoyl-CoA hydratase/isomerase family protein [Deltaproteobacteria bacterium]|nr:enoyl-CoA hydratase/isomerase family protein [Deltaproteobacteria bacterium]